MSEPEPKPPEKRPLLPQDQALLEWYGVIMWGKPPFLVKDPEAKKLLNRD